MGLVEVAGEELIQALFQAFKGFHGLVLQARPGGGAFWKLDRSHAGQSLVQTAFDQFQALLIFGLVHLTGPAAFHQFLDLLESVEGAAQEWPTLNRARMGLWSEAFWVISR